MINRSILTLILLIYSIFSTAIYVEAAIPNKTITPIAEQGVIDLTDINFTDSGIIKLRGDWEYYHRQLLTPEQFYSNEDIINTNYAKIPLNSAKPKIGDQIISPTGYATFRLNIKIADIDTYYGLVIKYFSSSYSIWIDGTLIKTVGEVGTSKETYTPKYLATSYIFKPKSENIEIVIQTSNYHHRRAKYNDILFGPSEQIKEHTNKSLVKTSMIFGALIIFSLYYFVMNFIYKRDRASLYFATFSLVVAIRSSVVGDRILVNLFPNIPAELVTKLGFLPVFVLLPLLILYVREFFSSPAMEQAARISKIAIIAFTTVILLTPLSIYDLIFQYGQWVFFVGALYLIIILIKDGFFSNIRGSWIMAAGCAVILVSAIHDYIRELNLIHTSEMLSIGILLFIVLQAIFIAWRYNDAYEYARALSNENKLISQQLKTLNEDLESKVKMRTMQLEQANERLELLSKIDSLTGLANRRFFDERLQEKWIQALTKQTPMSLIMIDIDCFKQYNDNYGHIEGDNCLKKIATELANSISYGMGFVARYGGEEFIILLSDTNANTASLIAEKIRKRIERLKIEHEFSSASNVVTISLGVNSIDGTKNVTVENFIEDADKALYKAKQIGRNKVVHIKDI